MLCRTSLFFLIAMWFFVCVSIHAQIEPDAGQAGQSSNRVAVPGANRTLALICVAANDFYFGGASGGIYLPEEVLDDELDAWTAQGLTQNRA